MADFNVPESCRGAADVPWVSQGGACSHCGRPWEDEARCDGCGKAFCERCAANPEVLFYCDRGCCQSYCAECSESFRKLLELIAGLKRQLATKTLCAERRRDHLNNAQAKLSVLRAENKRLSEELRKWLERAARPLDEAGKRRIEDVLSMGTRPPTC